MNRYWYKALFNAAGVAVPLLLAIGSASAAEGGWSDETICGAGVDNYFFLKTPATHIGESDGWHVFRSASGGTYDCQLEGDVVAFRWKNDSGPMTSNITRFEVIDGSLVLKGDFGPARFELLGGTWSRVN